jgi:hypothetical protein
MVEMGFMNNGEELGNLVENESDGDGGSAEVIWW